MRLIDADELRSELIKGHDLVGAKYVDLAPTIEPCEDAISRERLKKDLSEWCTNLGNPKTLVNDDVMAVIDNIPSVAPSRPKGEWKITNTYKDHNGRIVDRVEHTDCGYIWHREMGEPLHNLCPNCGADMRGEDNE